MGGFTPEWTRRLSERMVPDMAYQNGSLRKIKRKGGDVWYFRYRRNGNEVAVKIGAFPAKAAARREVDRLGLREQANAPLTDDKAVPVTFGRLVGSWLKKELSTQAVTSRKGIAPTCAATSFRSGDGLD